MKKVLAAVLAFVMVLSMLPAGIITSSALTSGDYTYTVTDSKATITAFSGTAANVTIPGTLGGYPVTEIGEIAFSNKDTLVSVVFPECLSSIGDSAFSYCDALTQVSIPNSVVSIGVDAFNWCTVLSSVSIGRGLAALGNDAFTDCTILTQIVVDGQNLNFSTRDGVLFNKNQTTLICCPHGITGAYNIPDGVKIISEDAFFHCKKLTSVFFPDSLTSIGIWAFYGCEGITSITLGNELTAIGLYAFTYCYKLISAYFLSNAPTSEAGVFSSCASGFTTYHLSDKTGFTSPPWNVYPTAVFTQPGQYTITFNANGGTGGTSALMTSGKALTVPAVSKAGYVFNGWSPAVPVSVPEADTTYVAQWRETNPAITFNSNGGSEAAAITQAYNTPVEKPADPLKDGVTFGGWYMDPALTTPVVWPFTVTQSTVFYAKWNAENCYTIIFNANSGTGGTSVVMPAGDPLTAPAVARTGYTLAGWAPAVPVTVPAANTTYTAQWTANTYSVNYNGNGNITGSTASSTHTYDVSANLTANGFIKTGNSFLGWSTNQSPTSAAYTNGQNVLNLTLNQGEVITLYAVWSANQYTITFSANGGTGGTSSSMLYGAALTAPTVTRMNYSFSSWSPAVPATVPAANTTYTAQWTGIQFAVTFDAQGGTVSPVTSTVTYAKTYGAGTGGFPTPTKTGYTFGGWYTGTGGTGTKILSTTTATTTAPQTLYAKWTAFTYTVVYNGNGSTGGSMSSTSHTYNTAKALRANGFTYTGYAFIGWATSAGGDVVYSDGQSVINLTETSGATITLYAKWNDVNAHVITFDANGGTGGKSTTLIAGSPLTAPTVTRTGYTLTGWSPEVPATVPFADTIYVAQWSINSYTITFDAGYGTGSAPSVMQNYNTVVNLPTTGFSRTGYTFIGWNTEPDATTALSSYTVTGYNEILFAVYSLDYYNLTLKLNDGTSGNYLSFSLPVDTRVYYGYYYFEPYDPYDPGYPRIVPVSPWDPINPINPYDPYDPWNNYDPDLYYITIEYPYFIPEPIYGPCGTTESYGYTPPARTGYDFVGWSASPTGTSATYSTTMQATDKTLYAVWTEHVPDYVMITFDANGGEGGTSDLMNPGDPLTPPIVSKEGYLFDGWAPAVPPTVPAYDSTFTAQWVSAAADYTQLYSWIADAEGLNRDIYTSESLAAVDDALANAYEAVAAEYQSPMQGTVDEIAFALANAFAELEIITDPELAALIALAQAENLPVNAAHDPAYMVGGERYIAGGFTNNGYYPRGMFTSSSITALEEAVITAKSTIDPMVYPPIDKHLVLLQAVNNLELEPADYTELTSYMNRAENLNRGFYSAEDLASVDEAMGYAYDAMQYKKPTQESVDATAILLQGVLWELPADISVIISTWNDFQAHHVQSNYTPESWDRVVSYYNDIIGWNLPSSLQSDVALINENLVAVISLLELRAVTYTVKYQTAGGVTLHEDLTYGATATDLITENALEITGYTPAYANLQKTMTGIESENIIIFSYSANLYTITFDANGGAGGIEHLFDFGEALTAPAVAREGYVFIGWSQAVPATVGAEDANFTALWNLLGDLNGSDSITPIDALMTLQGASEKVTLTDIQRLAADIDSSGTISPIDALKILQFTSGKISSF